MMYEENVERMSEQDAIIWNNETVSGEYRPGDRVVKKIKGSG